MLQNIAGNNFAELRGLLSKKELRRLHTEVDKFGLNPLIKRLFNNIYTTDQILVAIRHLRKTPIFGDAFWQGVDNKHVNKK